MSCFFVKLWAVPSVSQNTMAWPYLVQYSVRITRVDNGDNWFILPCKNVLSKLYWHELWVDFCRTLVWSANEVRWACLSKCECRLSALCVSVFVDVNVSPPYLYWSCWVVYISTTFGWRWVRWEGLRTVAKIQCELFQCNRSCTDWRSTRIVRHRCTGIDCFISTCEGVSVFHGMRWYRKWRNFAESVYCGNILGNGNHTHTKRTLFREKYLSTEIDEGCLKQCNGHYTRVKLYSVLIEI